LSFLDGPFGTQQVNANLWIDFTNRVGIYTPGQRDGIALGGAGGLVIDRTRPLYSISGGGYDRDSSEYLLIGAPIGATTVSVVNDLLSRVGDQTRVKRALALDAGPLRFLTDRDLLTFSATAALASADSAIKADGGRLTNANIRLLALMLAGNVYAGDLRSQQIIPVSIPFGSDLGFITAYLANNPNARFFDGGTEALLRSLRPASTPGPVMRDDVSAAFAHLVDQYALAAGIVLDDPSTRARYMLGLRGWLVPRLLELRTANSAEAAARALAIRVPTITAETAVFADARPNFPDSGAFLPAADFIQLTPGSSMRVVALTNDSRVPSLLTNDLIIGFVETRPPAQILQVSVPAANAGAVSAVLNADQTTDISVTPGFSGITWFDYRARGGNGQEANGRVFVLVR
jgi:hypothetical protein